MWTSFSDLVDFMSVISALIYFRNRGLFFWQLKWNVLLFFTGIFSRLNQTFICFNLKILSAASALFCNTQKSPAEVSIVLPNLVLGLFLIIIPSQREACTQGLSISDIPCPHCCFCFWFIREVKSEMDERLRRFSSSSVNLPESAFLHFISFYSGF